MALVVGRGTVLAMQVVGIDGRITERDLIVVRVIERFGKCIGAVKLKALREAVIKSEPQSVIVSVDGGLQIGDGFRTTGRGIENRRRERHPNDEVRSQIVNAIDFQDPVVGDLILNAEIELLHHRIAHIVVDDVDAFGCAASAGSDGTGESRVRARRCEAGDEVSVAVKKVGAAEGHVNRRSATRESALTGYYFERDPVVIKTVAAGNVE